MSNEFPNFDFEVSDIIKSNNGILEEDWRVLRRLKIPDMFNRPSSSKAVSYTHLTLPTKRIV